MLKGLNLGRNCKNITVPALLFYEGDQIMRDERDYEIPDDAPIVTGSELAEMINNNPDKLYLVGFIEEKPGLEYKRVRRRVIIYESDNGQK